MALPMAPAAKYQPVGFCVYCGDSIGRLTDEHIIPLALNGNHILQSASCDACARVTSEIERRVLKGHLQNMRFGLGLKSRHPKRDRPSALPITLSNDQGKLWQTDLPISEGVQTAHFPVFQPPLFLGGTAKSADMTALEVSGVVTLVFGNVPTVLSSRQASGFETNTRIDIRAFNRMLAKIAHCYHVSQRGAFPLTESPILPTILTDHGAPRAWIGTVNHMPLERNPGSTALHLLHIEEATSDDGARCTAVRIKLFAPMNSPTYMIATRLQR